MKDIVFPLLLVVGLCMSHGIAQDTHGNDTTTVLSTSPGVTTSSPNHTTAISTSETTKETTSHVPTTTSHAETSTGARPTTEHPTAAPTASPLPQHTWGVAYANKSYCILLKADIVITLAYNNTKSGQISTGSVSVKNPPVTYANGSCGAETQSITVFFLNDWSLTFNFAKKENATGYSLGAISLDWDLASANFSDAPTTRGSNGYAIDLFNTQNGYGYLCTANKTLYKNATIETGPTSITTVNLQFEAFQNKQKGEFAKDYTRCSDDNISNLVPIIVGACLGGLIVIVLVAYLIGRKRSRRGYESV